MQTNFKFLAIPVFSLFLACSPSPPPVQVAPDPPRLYLLVQDWSQSVDRPNWTSGELHEWVLGDSLSGHIQLGGMYIASESYEQRPFVSKELTPGVQPLDPGWSMYHTARAQRKNRANFEQFELEARREVDRLSEYLQQVPSHADTDINGALEKAKVFVSQPGYSDYEVFVIIDSDLDHDLPDNTSLEPVVFPTNVSIISVGKKQNINLSEVFPENPAIEITALNRQFFHSK